MACPYFERSAPIRAVDKHNTEQNEIDSNGVNGGELPVSDEMVTSLKMANEITYASYLKIDDLISCQQRVTNMHDEHLFIVTHQAFELWFKQIIFEVDSVREILASDHVDESKMLTINNRLERCVLIVKLLSEQFQILETMTPHDFMDFRIHLGSSSGFQSHQFRLLENKLGVVEANRIKYNKRSYREVFRGDKQKDQELEDSLKEMSLFRLIERWLERTPGLSKNDYDFWARYEIAVDQYLTEEFLLPSEIETDPYLKKTRTEEYLKEKNTFDGLFNQVQYAQELRRHDRRMTYQAFQGAMMISCYRDEPRFHQPFQILKLLMDMDSFFTKWRYNHAVMVQRMIGAKMGTGGSSGYHYLRSTVSDRYKIFLDLFLVSNYLIPRAYLPALSGVMKRRLSIMEDAPKLPLPGCDVCTCLSDNGTRNDVSSD